MCLCAFVAKMPIICINKHLSDLFPMVLGAFLLVACVTTGGCQTKEEKYDAQLAACAEKVYKERPAELKCFEEMIKSYPENLFVHIFLARAYRESGQLDKAQKSIDIFNAAYPKYAAGYTVQCEILRDKKEFIDALFACTKAMSLDPENKVDPMMVTASVHEAEGNLKRAEFVYLSALKIDPQNQFALVSLGRLYETQGELDKAIETYETLLKQDLDLKGKVEEGLKKVKQKRDEMRKENESEPQKPNRSN